MTTALNYEGLVADFKRKLLTQLRGHSADAEYLEAWVPEDDPVKSILNIVESAQAYGQHAVRVSVAKTTMSAKQQQDLLRLIAPMGQVRIMDHGQTCEIEVAIGERQS